MNRAAALAGLWIAGAVVAGSATPALADVTGTPADLVAVSGNGVIYTREESGLFDGRFLVPDGTATDSFSVRNDGATSGYLRVVLTSVRIPDRFVLDALTISSSTTARPGRSMPLSAAQPCLTLLAGQPIAPGQGVRVTTALALGDLTATRGQGVPIAFRLEVLLSERARQNASGCPVAEASPPPRGGGLASTGLTGMWGASAAGVSLLAAGSALTGWRARRPGRRRRAGVGA